MDNENEKMVYIYVLGDPRTGEPKYVGKAEDPMDRYKQHLETGNLTQNLPKNTWIKSLLSENKYPTIIVVEVVGESNWKEAEKWWVSYFREQGANLKNSDDGGSGGENRIISNETREKLREFHTGKAWNRGRVFSEEWRKNLSESHKRYYERLRNLGDNLVPAPSPYVPRQLTDEDVRKIRQLIEHTDIPQAKIAKEFGVGGPMITGIKNGKSYKRVKNEDGTDYIPYSGKRHIKYRSGTIPIPQVIEIKRLLKSGISMTDIERKTAISYRIIASIKYGSSYAWVKDEEN